MRRWGLALVTASLVAALCLAACSRPATQLVVVVRTDFVEPDPLDAIVVTVESPEGAERSQQRFELARLGASGAGRYALPLSLGVVPEQGDAQRRVRVIVRGFGADRTFRVERSALTGFIRGASLELPLFLPRACANVMCPRGTTCVAGPPVACAPDFVDPGLLPPVRADGGELTSDATLPLDGVTVAPLDGAPSADVAETEDGAPGVLPPPRPVAPLSGSVLNTTEPELRWELPPGVTEVAVDLCGDRACGTVLATRFAAGTRVVFDGGASPLPANRVAYWRVRSARAGVPVSASSPVWEFWTGRGRAAQLVVGQAFDANGDGRADVAVGAPDAVVRGMVRAGVVRVYQGGSMGADIAPVTTIEGAADERLGHALAAGDVNGDGYVDLVAAGPHDPSAGSGVVHVHVGGPTGLNATPVSMIRAGANTRFGYSVACADVDNDGYADVLVGSPYAPLGGAMRGGGVYIFRGGTTPPGARPVMVLTPDAADDELGTVVASLGDVNGDGVADLAASAPALGDAYVRVYFGGASAPPSLALALTLRATSRDVGFGAAITGAGDLDGDGRSDVVIGSPLASSPTTTAAGEARVYFGPLLPGGAPREERLYGSAVNERFGASVAGAGDTNGDGYYDLIVGAPGAPGLGGCARQFYGVVAFSQTTAPVSTLFPVAAGEVYGGAVAGLGDTNGDGIGDFAVGGVAGRMGAGVVRVYSGTSLASLVELGGAAAGEQFGFAIVRR